ncbi:tRNA uridine-5-carboxymethylaminomethyl(34) synthesis enzyme MnmG [Sphingomonas sp. 3-13AW]|uniref:tRNA uridine-5-carboxymethylaminomethyl(34) synthesis enzyme MnmG n=1 Tax=Sphingomonas sp. 3-13AW TaxID=3050450 RepID=UPI003BB54B2A
MSPFDVIVVGGGHAGTEAAAAAARRGARTALLSFDLTKLGAMSCNPAIGGLGKGHIVREVDAFDGLIARAADQAAIHYRMLNRSKGAAVQGPRVQADRVRYAAAIQAMLRAQANLTLVEGEAEQLLVEQGRVAGVLLADGTRIDARAVVLATGTFLGGRIFRGEDREEGGRVGERAATAMGIQLRALGLPMARLKTGTPPRLDGRTIDWAALEEQPSDVAPWTMSPMSPGRVLPQLFCAVSRTTEETHAIIRSGLDRSPLFSGAIGAPGPRYCPSIEDKVHRFADRDGHQIFLEPEGLDTSLVYPNGISTSLPVDIQQAMIRSIPGLSHTRIVTPGYAVEYDHVDPRALDPRLALGDLPGVFCAGQINGTTGYEEAAGQGLVAGANAAAFACALEPLLLDRASSYLGVMVDDLILQGVSEPYRMLTARAEYRLTLRADNAPTRLSGIAEAAGLLGSDRLAWVRKRAAARAELEQRFDAKLSASTVAGRGGQVSQDGVVRSVREWLRFPGVSVEQLLPEASSEVSPQILTEAIEDARYAPYLERQQIELAEMRANDHIRLPDTFPYNAVPGLSAEMVQRLTTARPTTLGAASRVRGVTPAALAAVLVHARKMVSQ